jgi:hypothetical protein
MQLLVGKRSTSRRSSLLFLALALLAFVQVNTLGVITAPGEPSVGRLIDPTHAP